MHTLLARLFFASLGLTPLLATAQIEEVKSFAFVTYGLVPRDLVAGDGVLYFRAWTAADGMELWKSDGTTAGTVLVKDIAPGAASGLAAEDNLFFLNGTVYFAADDGTTGWELWKSDGTEAGTQLVKDIYPGPIASAPHSLTAFGNAVLFHAASADNLGFTLHTTDGTNAGTHQLLSAQNEAMGSSGTISVRGSVAYFCGRPNAATEGQLWYTDGTLQGCALVLATCPGGPYGYTAGQQIVVDNMFYFTANDCVNGQEFWRSDGSGSGTFMIKDVNPGAQDATPYNIVALDGQVLFAALDDTGNGLYHSDGTEIGTYKIATMYIPQLWSGKDQSARRLGDVVLFGGNDPVNGTELWRSDGTVAGTSMVKDIRAGASGSVAGVGSPFNVYDSVLYFAAETTIQGVELWRSDGTEAGTVMVQDRAPGLNSFGPDDLVRMGDHVYMTGNLTPNDRGLYRLAVDNASGISPMARPALSVRPNPSTGLFQVQLPAEVGPGIQRISLTDALGRTVPVAATTPGRTLALDLSSTAPGAYLLTVHTSDGSSLTTRILLDR